MLKKLSFTFLLPIVAAITLTAAAPVANFTLPGENIQTIWSENFDNGADGWEIVAGNSDSNYNWQRSTTLEGARSFTTIDPDNVASMLVKGINAPRDGKQEEWLISPVISDLIENAQLELWLGYTKAYFSSGNNIKIFAAEAADEPEWNELWDAVNDTEGDSPFQFRKITLSLGDYAGKSIRFAVVYYVDTGVRFASGGDLVVDGLSIFAPGGNESIDILAGESVTFFDNSSNEPDSWEWSFEGGTPAVSTDKNPVVQYMQAGSFAVTLTASNSNGSHTVSKENVVNVSNIAPVARIGSPSMFRAHEGTRAYFVPAKEDILFTDRSENYPTSWNWSFEGGELKSDSDAESATVFYPAPGFYGAALSVSNSEGESSDAAILEAGYRAIVSNMQPGETYTSFQMDQNEYFPGNNSRIEAYAEYFEKPAIPMLLDSIEIKFVGNSMHEQDIMSRIKTFRVRVYKAENGQPVGQELAWGIQETLQVEFDRGRPTGIYFGSDLPLVVDFPFFVVVEELPHSTEYELNFTMGMAPWRNQGNTAYLRKKKEDKFIAAHEYFGEGKQTSYGITPHITYLVLHPESEELTFESEAGSKKIDVSATVGWSATVEEGANWCSVGQVVNNRIDGSLELICEANESGAEREALVTLDNGWRQRAVRVVQNPITTDSPMHFDNSALRVVHHADGSLELLHGNGFETLTLYTADGRELISKRTEGTISTHIAATELTQGVYIVRLTGKEKRENIKITIK